MAALTSLCTQLIPAAISSLGALAVIPGPDKVGKLRIPGASGRIITFTGMVLFLCPWVIAAFIDQPRFKGCFGIASLAMGIISVLAGLLLYAISFRYLWPAFKANYNEFSPANLITNGPYRVVRHPIYLAVLLFVAGFSYTLRAELTVLMLPLLFIELKFITIYEEKWILRRRFPEKYAGYKGAVPRAITGVGLGVVFLILYVFTGVLVLATVFGS